MEEICGRRMNLDKRGERKIGRFVGERKLREMGEGTESGEGRGSRVWPGNRKRGGRGW